MARAKEPPTAQVLTVEEIAHRLKVSEATVYNLLRQRKIPGFRVGRAWRVEEADLADFIQRQKSRWSGATQEDRSG